MNSSVLKIKNFHCFVLGRCDQNVILVLYHRPYEVLMLCLVRKEKIGRGTWHGFMVFFFFALAAGTTLYLF